MFQSVRRGSESATGFRCLDIGIFAFKMPSLDDSMDVGVTPCDFFEHEPSKVEKDEVSPEYRGSKNDYVTRLGEVPEALGGKYFCLWARV